MRTNLFIAAAVLAAHTCLAQETPAPSQPAAAAAPSPAPTTAPAPVSEMPPPPVPFRAAGSPVVLPAETSTPAAASPLADDSRSPLATTAVTASSAGAAGAAGWSRESLDLRDPVVTPVRTNRWGNSRAVLPKAAKPERRSVGGFLSGVANLFNPFAPVEKGVSSAPDHWYDANIHAAPLPRSSRDERYHEPKTELVVYGIDPPSTLKAPPAGGSER